MNVAVPLVSVGVATTASPLLASSMLTVSPLIGDTLLTLTVKAHIRTDSDGFGPLSISVVVVGVVGLTT